MPRNPLLHLLKTNMLRLIKTLFGDARSSIVSSLVVGLSVSSVCAYLNRLMNATKELAQLPIPLWVALLLGALAVLITNNLLLHSKRTPKISKEHQIVLVSLSIVPEATAEDIAKGSGKNLELIISLLEYLESFKLIRKSHQASVYETGWELLPSGREYLAKNNLQPNP